MTKEELEKEAEENSFRYTLDKPWACEVERKQIMAHFEKAYLAGAEPREKRIEELEAQNNWLEGCKSELGEFLGKANDKIADLEAQLEREKNLNQCLSDHNEQLRELIEKMECCGNCVHFDFTEPNYCHKGVYRANQKVCGEWCFGN